MAKLEKPDRKLPNEELIGTVHIAGGAGPLYVVLAVRDETAEIEFPESGEKAELPIEAVRKDPQEA